MTPEEKISALGAMLIMQRNQALEEAAKEVDDENPTNDWLLTKIADAIRALKVF